MKFCTIVSVKEQFFVKVLFPIVILSDGNAVTGQQFRVVSHDSSAGVAHESQECHHHDQADHKKDPDQGRQPLGIVPTFVDRVLFNSTLCDPREENNHESQEDCVHEIHSVTQ